MEPNTSISSNNSSKRREEILNVILSTWRNLDADLIAPYLAENFQYNSVWVVSTMRSKEEYLYYLIRKFETIRKSGDCPLVRVINENGLDYPHLVQRGNGIETILDFSLQEDGKISRMLMRDRVNLKIVPPQEWSRYDEEYNKFLPEAFNIAGLSLQQLFKEKGFEFPSFSWIQTSLVHPSFQHLCFGLDTDVYSVLIAIQADEEGVPVVSRQAYDNLIRETRENNLIPCFFPIAAGPRIPYTITNNLFHAETGALIELNRSSQAVKVPMSKWEINNFGINVVMNYLREKGYKVNNYCDLVGIDPQIWFQKDNELCYVIVRTNPAGKRREEFSINKELLLRLVEYGGYFADVQFSSASPILTDDDGSIIPLSKRFEDQKLYRGDGFYCNFRGLQKIERAITENGFIQVSDQELYDL